MFVKDIKSLEEYNSIVENNDFFAIKFHAAWCGPCRVLNDVLSKIDSSKINNVPFYALDVDSEFADEITRTWNIRNIPVIVFIKNGKEVHRIVGLTDVETIIKVINTTWE